MSGAEKFFPDGCDGGYGDCKKAPALRPAELNIDGAFASPFVNASESTPPSVTPGGRPRSNACSGNGKQNQNVRTGIAEKH